MEANNKNSGCCPTCGNQFFSKRPKIYCSMKCYLASPRLKESLKLNNIKANKKIKTTCIECGKESLEKPSRGKEKMFCNQVCYRKYYAKRFDKWIASPEEIALPQNYDEFLTLEELPCLVKGCGWRGHSLSFHMNMSHGVKARDFKRAAGFNYSSGIISLTLKETLLNRPNDNGNNLLVGTGWNGGRTSSLEAKEHAIKSRTMILAERNGPPRVCKGCGKTFNQSTVFGKMCWCSVECRTQCHIDELREKKYPLVCVVCKKEFLGNKYQLRRSDKNEDVVCSLHCRQKRNGKIRHNNLTLA